MNLGQYNQMKPFKMMPQYGHKTMSKTCKGKSKNKPINKTTQSRWASSPNYIQLAILFLSSKQTCVESELNKYMIIRDTIVPCKRYI